MKNISPWCNNKNILSWAISLWIFCNLWEQVTKAIAWHTYKKDVVRFIVSKYNLNKDYLKHWQIDKVNNDYIVILEQLYQYLHGVMWSRTSLFWINFSSSLSSLILSLHFRYHSPFIGYCMPHNTVYEL